MVPRDELSECLHAALRKFCDSSATTIAWNVINLMKEPDWNSYLDWVYLKMPSEAHNQADLAGALKTISLSWSDIKQTSWVGNYQVRILQSSFKLFSSKDWMGYAALLEGDDEA